QADGSSVVVTGKFAVSASGQTVTLAQTGNGFASLGDITATAATLYLGGASQATSLVGNSAREFTVTTLSLLGSSALTLGATGAGELHFMGATGGITINGRSLTLASAVTSHGGAVTIDLGTGATNIYANGAAGNKFTTSNKNLTLTAGSVTVTGGATEVLFKLGTGNFRDGSLSAAVLGATHVAGKTILVWDGVGTAPTVVASEELHNFNEFTSRALPTGLVLGNFDNTDTGTKVPALVMGSLSDDLTFVGGSFSGAVAMTLASGKSFSFKGTNSFTDTLSLTTSGAAGTITQVSGSSLRMAASKALSISAGGSVELGEAGNQITTISGLISGGLLTLKTSTGLSIGGTITTAGATPTITITAASLTLSSDVTATGGDANITVSGAFTNAGRKWTT
ncbi:MAG: hypothetical protein ORO03_11315, partial [Alphaproteobacteria bacterium]|nr:hypothetical protein [Alphaproteobacteria bacterium]